MKKTKPTQPTLSIVITKARLKAIRLAVGRTDEVLASERIRGCQAPAGSYESDYRFRKFTRHHLLVG